MVRKVISFHYTVTDAAGLAVDSSQGKEPLTFMEGAGQIISGLEKALVVLKEGEKKKILVVAADAYGEHNKDLIVTVARSQMPTETIHVGDRFRGGPTPDAPIFMVTDVSDTEVKLDGNHPLAGQDLSFDVEITNMRDATPEEIQHGHAHGKGGHSH